MKPTIIATCGVEVSEAARGEIAANLRRPVDQLRDYQLGEPIADGDAIIVASMEDIAGFHADRITLRWLDELAPGSIGFGTMRAIHATREAFEAAAASLEPGRFAMIDAGAIFASVKPAPMSAPEILDAAAMHMRNRASERDQPGGERSMPRIVATFNALTGHNLTERDGWVFMVALKLGRAYCTPAGTPDDYQDGAAYIGLAGECAAR